MTFGSGPGEDTVEIPIDWVAAATAGAFMLRVRDAAATDSEQVLRVIAGLVGSAHSGQEWMTRLTADDMRGMIAFGTSASQDPLVREIVAAGPLVSRLVFDQLVLLYHTR
jgi:hypothetical protein